MIAIFLIAVGFCVGIFLALLALLPELRIRAQKRSRFRNILRTTLAIITLLLIFDGFSFGLSQLQPGAGMCIGTLRITGVSQTRTMNCDTEDDFPQYTIEVWLRTMLPPPARDVCIFNQNTCAVIAEYQVFSRTNLVNTWSTYIGFLLACVMGAVINWVLVSFVTKPEKLA